jgi:hypothetical protein
MSLTVQNNGNAKHSENQPFSMRRAPAKTAASICGADSIAGYKALINRDLSRDWLLNDHPARALLSTSNLQRFGHFGAVLNCNNRLGWTGKAVGP